MCSSLRSQVVRTFGCPHKDRSLSASPFWGFAGNGEFTNAELFYKAVANAREYILYADQFMNYPDVHAAVAEALPRVERVILVTNNKWWLEMGNTRMRHLQNLAMRPLLESEHAHKVSIFTLVSNSSGCRRAPAGHHQIYMHAKTVLVDDRFLLTGSMGLERAGFTNDHEIGFGVYSRTHVMEYRRLLSAEYLQLPTSDPLLTTYRTDFAEWDRQANAASGRLRHYRPKKASVFGMIGASTLYNTYEPDGRC